MRTANWPPPPDGRSPTTLLAAADEQRRADGTAVSTHEDIERALAALGSFRSSLLTARGDAAMAATRLYGAGAARASDLGEKLADALAFCERLAFVVEGDMRADL